MALWAAATFGAAAIGVSRLALAALALGLLGWWWGSARLAVLDRSVLLHDVDRAERSLVVVTGPPRLGRFTIRLPVNVWRFGALRLREAALLQLPRGRAPPEQGAVLELVAEVRIPRGPAHGFDEKTWLRRHGIHVVLQGSRWRVVGHRHGLIGIPDRVRSWLAAGVAAGLHGERRGVVEGVVLGDDQGLSPELKAQFRASGLYHLLAVSGQNVALVAGGVLAAAWLLGVSRWAGELGALAGIGAYVLAVGAQPSVVRAGIAGALTSLAWLTARAADRWYCLMLGALALLAWNPYVLLDAGFQLSFVAVAAIFMLVPRLQAVLAGYPLPRSLAAVVAVSAACGAATAPILWLQFGAIPLLTIPANALAAPAVGPVLGLALASAVVQPLAPSAAAALAQLDGLCAAYLATCARVVGSLPFAQARSPQAAAAVVSGAVTISAYAWRRWRSSSPHIS
ncbi:MAG: ComEC/Rec2 family competence protein [Gaiellaceae bacterium]